MTEKRLYAALAACVAMLAAGCSATQTAEERELANTFKEHANDKPVASPMAYTEPAQPVTGEAVAYAVANEQDIIGWMAKPVEHEGELHGLIVIHEWWGLTDSIRRVSERLAGEGYMALAVDLYNGKVAEEPRDAMKISRELGKNKPAGLANIAEAISYLKKQGVTKIGVIGWCMGGRWSLFTALNYYFDIDAAIIYYGSVTDDKEELEVLDMPVLGVFAGSDFIVQPKAAYAFAKSMAELKKDLEFYMYRDAQHAFSNPTGTEYNPEAAEDAWRKTQAFLERNL